MTLELGVCYYPEQCERSLWRDDARRMAILGLDWVRLAEFSWASVERRRGCFTWDWLDEVIGILGEAGLKVMMCTPTAAPPKWLVDEHPDILPVGPDGRTRGFGARRHYCFSSRTYLAEACRIATEYARRYGQNPYVQAWQIDNEYGDHDTARSYSPEALRAFRLWLTERYGTINAVNEAWGTAFWGMHYNGFDEIELPNGTVDQPAPGHAMDFARFSSDQIRRFNTAQAEIIREHVPGRPVTHNFMANSFDFDHYAVAADLDFACWDSYPLGALWHGHLSNEEKLKHLRTGSPDYQAFYSDLYRHVGGGKVWITEQQPGPVNWADHNPAPAAGMVRLWTWQAYAHGVDTVCFFRWRQAASGQEQYHSGLLLPDGTPGAAYHEVAQVARERRQLPEAGRREPAPVAVVLDYPSRWALEILPQGMDVPGRAALWDWYGALAQLGVDADIVAPGADLSGYRLVCVPSLAVCTEEFAARLRAADARVLLGPRSGSKTGDMHIPGILPPGPLSALIDLRVTGVESLPPGHAEQVIWQGCQYAVGGWRESMTTSEPVVATFAAPHGAGSPAIAGNDRCRYLACLPQGEFLTGFMADCLAWAGIAAAPTGPDLRITRRGALSFAFNFGAGPAELPAGKDAALLIGGRQIPPAGLAVWRAVAEPGG